MRRRVCGSNGFEGDGGGVGVRTSQLGPATPSCVRIRNIRPEILSHSFTLYSCTEKNNVKNKIFLKKKFKIYQRNYKFQFCVLQRKLKALSLSVSLFVSVSLVKQRENEGVVLYFYQLRWGPVKAPHGVAFTRVSAINQTPRQPGGDNIFGLLSARYFVGFLVTFYSRFFFSNKSLFLFVSL